MIWLPVNLDLFTEKNFLGTSYFRERWFIEGITTKVGKKTILIIPLGENLSIYFSEPYLLAPTEKGTLE